MSWGEELRIETPEQIDLNLEVAGPGSRFYAQLLDWMIKWLIVGLLALASFALGGAVGGLSQGTAFFLLAIGGAAAFAFFIGYDIYFEGCRNGRTPGKTAAGLRVVREDGGPIDIQAAAIRNLLGVADFLPFCYLGGGLIAAVNARGQRLGDMAAGTVVIRERAAEVSHDLEPRILARASGEIAFGPEELAKCTTRDLHVLQSFFARAEVMNHDALQQLGEKLCETFLLRTGYVRTRTPDSSQAIGFLASLYRDLALLRRHN
jgi:uncharacterized RDD family membrane protein YckC